MREQAKANSDVTVLLAAGRPALPADQDALFAIPDDREERLHRWGTWW